MKNDCCNLVFFFFFLLFFPFSLQRKALTEIFFFTGPVSGAPIPKPKTAFYPEMTPCVFPRIFPR